MSKPRRRRLKDVFVAAWARHTASDGEPVIVVRVTSFDSYGRKVHDEERTITVAYLAKQLFGEDLPEKGDYLMPKEATPASAPALKADRDTEGKAAR